MKALYLHGFNSASKWNDKTNALYTALKSVGITLELMSYDTFDTYHNIKNYIPNDYDLYIGSSLGGFFAMTKAKKNNVPFIVINPSINPNKSTKKYVNKPYTNYATGDTNTMSLSVSNSYPTFIDQSSMIAGLVLLDRGDTVLSSLDTYDQLSDRYQCVIFDGGSHRFDHINNAIPVINDFINNLDNQGLFNG